MKKVDIIRAWKDPEYRAGLSEEDRAGLPVNPAGVIELTDDELAHASGMYGPPQTTAWTCTNYTWRAWLTCCPS